MGLQCVLEVQLRPLTSVLICCHTIYLQTRKIQLIPKKNQRFTISSIRYFRSRRFYGKPVIEGVQHRSETIYMPHFINHAVYNLDQTVSVADNPFYNTAIEESAFLLFRNGRNGYSYINDSHINLHEGTVQILKTKTNYVQQRKKNIGEKNYVGIYYM